ncbi:hypothetical protein Tco_0750538 [Tanacetum coccineum]|uniref:Uncharacterized protein n=1 Tax=Tanacetum coccineum TaxID=301880 RepID=A0ABQ4Z4P8_9ASTR
MCCQPLPPPLSPPSAKLMIMALEEYGYQRNRGLLILVTSVFLKSDEGFGDELRGFKMFDLDDFIKMFDDIMVNCCKDDFKKC